MQFATDKSSPSYAAVETLETRRLFSIVVALGTKNELFTVDSTDPDTVLAKTTVKRGLQRKELILGIDYRPANNLLYGLGSTGRLYRIDAVTGTATAVAGPIDVPPSGTDFGFDFNPVPDRIRVVSDADQNLRLHPDTGAAVDSDVNTAGTQIDGNLDYADADANGPANPNVTAVAYTNNFPGAPNTTLYGIDTELNTLVTQGSLTGSPVSPNSGQLFTVGSLGVDPTGVAGFDIEAGAAGDNALAAFNLNGDRTPALFTINLSNGTASRVGQLGKSRKPVRDIAVVPPGFTVFAVTTKNELVAFDSNRPDLILQKDKITGLAKKQKIVSLDARPSTGVLYALGIDSKGNSKLYTIDPDSAEADELSDLTAAGLAPKAEYDIDFNPNADRLRLVNSVGQNLRINPDTGAPVDSDPATPEVNPDAALAYAAGDVNAGATPVVTGAAYDNSILGANATTLYVIDSGRDVLAIQGSPLGNPTSPNSGQLTTVGPLGVDVTGVQVGFDIVTDADDDFAFAAVGSGRKTPKEVRLHTVNLQTGAVSAIATIGGKKKLKVADIAVVLE